MSRLNQQLQHGRLYARLPVRSKRLHQAIESIAVMQEIAPRSYLSLSFGKQSIILAHMLYCVDPLTPMYFLASGESELIHNFAEVIESFTARWPVDLTIVQTDNVFDGRNLDWKESCEAGHFDLQNMCKREDWDGWYWGLAKDESKARRITLCRRTDSPHPLIFRYADGKYRCCPLANWELLDLAAYIAEYDLPLLDTYHRDGLEARTTARVTRKSAMWGGLTSMQNGNMNAFNRLCARFPEVRGADRHA